MVNHLEQMVTLLFYELKSRHANLALEIISSNVSTTNGGASCTPCLEYLLLENLLDKVYEWGLRTGKYVNNWKM